MGRGKGRVKSVGLRYPAGFIFLEFRNLRRGRALYFFKQLRHRLQGRLLFFASVTPALLIYGYYHCSLLLPTLGGGIVILCRCPMIGYSTPRRAAPDAPILCLLRGCAGASFCMRRCTRGLHLSLVRRGGRSYQLPVPVYIWFGNNDLFCVCFCISHGGEPSFPCILSSYRRRRSPITAD